MPWDERELRRQSLQRVLDAGRTAAERNVRGQSATPPELAEAIVRARVVPGIVSMAELEPWSARVRSWARIEKT